MLKKIFGLFSGQPRNSEAEKDINIPDEVVEAMTHTGDVLRYPPSEVGFPARVPGYALLKLQKEIISEIKRELMIRDSEFDSYIHPMLINFANFVHLLPASEYHHHRSQGGLLRHTLEVVLYSIKIAKSFEFDANETPVIKSNRALAWRLAVVVGALMHDAGKPISDLELFSKDKFWMPTVNSVHVWASDNNIDRYFIIWRPDRHERHHNTSLTKLTDIVPKTLLEFITEEGNDIYNELTEALAGSNSYRAQSSKTETGSVQKNKIHKIVSTADARSVRQDLRRYSGDAVRSSQTGVSIVARVVDAMRYLLKSGEWKPNRAGSPVWVTSEGLFIVWGSAINRITEIVKESGVNIPHSADGLADILLSYRLCILNENDSVYWRLAPHILNDKAHRESKEPKNSLSCLRIVDPVVLFIGDVLPNPASCRIKIGDTWKEFLGSGAKGIIKESVPYMDTPPTGNPLLKNVDPEILKGGSLPPVDDLPTDDMAAPIGAKPKDIIDHMLRINILSPDTAKAIRERDQKERKELADAAPETEATDTAPKLSEENSSNENTGHPLKDVHKGHHSPRKPVQNELFPSPGHASNVSESKLPHYDNADYDSEDYADSFEQYAAMQNNFTEQPDIPSAPVMTLKERLERAAIEQSYVEDEKNIRVNDAKKEVNLWEEARKRINSFDHDSVDQDPEYSVEIENIHHYSSMFRDAPVKTQGMMVKLINERQNELYADNYHLFINCRNPEDDEIYDAMYASGWVFKPFLENTQKYQMHKSKLGFFLRRGLNDDINLMSNGIYYRNILTVDPKDIYFSENDISRGIATYGIAKKTYDNQTIIALSFNALRQLAKSLDMDVSTLKFVIGFNFDVVHKRGVDHVYVDERITPFMVAENE